MVISYVLEREGVRPWETASLYIAGSGTQRLEGLIDGECTHAYCSPTPTQLQCCFFCCVTKSTLTSERRRGKQC